MNHPPGRPYDRLGLTDLTGRYLAALAASGGPGSFASHVPDPRRRTAGSLGMLEAAGAPVLLGPRLAAEGGQLAEIPAGQRLREEDLRAMAGPAATRLPATRPAWPRSPATANGTRTGWSRAGERVRLPHPNRRTG